MSRVICLCFKHLKEVHAGLSKERNFFFLNIFVPVIIINVLESWHAQYIVFLELRTTFRFKESVTIVDNYYYKMAAAFFLHRNAVFLIISTNMEISRWFFFLFIPKWHMNTINQNLWNILSTSIFIFLYFFEKLIFFTFS